MQSSMISVAALSLVSTAAAPAFAADPPGKVDREASGYSGQHRRKITMIGKKLLITAAVFLSAPPLRPPMTPPAKA
jgi:hypothetical protein